MAASASDTTPNTIVLIHGFWVTPRSWEHWKRHYEAKGYTVLTPAYPGFEVEVEALRADPTPIEQLEVPEIIDMLENMIGKLDRPPIIMGHSAGGVFTQILLDHGFGAAGVAINSAPTEGVKVIPLSQIRSGFPVLKNPANRHRAVGFTPEHWHYVFANTFDEQESQALYDRYHIPASGHVFWGSALANIHPGKDDTYVDYHNDSRPPLLFIVGKQDHLFPPKVGHSNAKHYKSKVGHRDRGVRRTTSVARDPGVGGCRGLRPRLGVEARGGAQLPERLARRCPRQVGSADTDIRRKREGSMNSGKKSKRLPIRIIAMSAVLVLVALVFSGGGHAAAGLQKSSGPRPTIVLVHGDWADASSWNA